EDDRLFDLKVFKPKPEELDSFISLGAEKIVRVEFEVPPEKKLKELPNYFCDEEYYQIIADQEIANRPQPAASKTTLFQQYGVDIPVEGKVGLQVSAKSTEFEFVQKGNRIIPAQQGPPALIAKYGKQIVSLVTEKARYTVKYDDFALPDRKTEPGKKYVYKIRLYQVKKPIKKVFAESDTVGIVPKDEPPFAPTATSALVDTVDRNVVMHFSYPKSLAGLESFFDNHIFVLYKTDIDDTLCERGMVIDTIDASWKAKLIEGVDIDEAFYIEVFDIAGQSARTSLIVPVDSKFKNPPIPENLRVVDFPDDNGLKLSVRWDPPTLAAGYKVEDILPKTKTINVEDKNLYLMKDTVIQLPDTAEIPVNAQKILTVSYTIPGGQKSLKVLYEIRANPADKALYPEFELNGLKKVDLDETGMIKFGEVEEREYVLNGWIVTKSGKVLQNPEAQVKLSVDATQINEIPIESSPYLYYIYRGIDPERLTTFEYRGIATGDVREFVDDYDKRPDDDYYYFVQVVAPSGFMNTSKVMGPIKPGQNLFNWNKIVVFLSMLVLVGVALYFIYHAKKGKKFYIRPIAGIVHIEEALGRATEMGKPIIYVTGLGYISELATLASITILGRVAKKAAEYQSKLLVPCYDPIVMIVAQETVRNAYMDEGRPDLYDEENIYYIAAQQFAYAAAVAGLMIREQSAANFFIGKFFAESLILAETGASVGAIQVAGTDDMTQLPFFITACDYTIIGEELYAASAYMSKDPMQQGSIKAQDFIKVLEMIIIVLGTAAATGGLWWIAKAFQVLGE
ncbi:hypothetical protein DRQ33_00970, partial [bacterium]